MNAKQQKKLLVSILFVGILLVAGAFAGQWLAEPSRLRPEGESPPDLLSKLFGESREVIGEQMYYQADIYYHSGVPHAQDSDHDQHDAGQSYHGNDHEHEENSRGENKTKADLWSRLNQRLKPRSPKHLKGERQEKEILPWLWATVKVDPGNINAWRDGAYFLAGRLDRPEDGVRFLKSGLEHNPESPELYFDLGTVYFHHVKDRTAASSAFKKARKAWIEQWSVWIERRGGRSEAEKATQGGDAVPSQLLYYRILSYIGKIAELEEDNNRAIRVYKEALRFAPSPRLKEDIQTRLEELKSE